MIVAALAAATLLSITGYAAVAATAATRMRAARPGALLGDLRSPQSAALDALSDATVRHAIGGDPLDGRLVDVAMARDVRRNGAGRVGDWLAVVGQLGWRDTPSLQNRLYVAAKAADMGAILDISDALMRRQQLMDQVIPVLSMVEADPALRGRLIDRLAGNPRWRGAFLGTTGHLKEREQLLARYELIGQLQRRHGRLGRGEVVPNIQALDRAGLPQYGFALWQRLQPGVTRPLDDSRFDQANRGYRSDGDVVPYQWQLMTGAGFSAEAVRDGARTMLSIDWSGRGVPVFAQQRTSARPGRYALDLEVSPEEKVELSALSFRLVCGSAVTPFEPTGPDSAHLQTAGRVSCSYPLLQIAGDVQSSSTAHEITIDRLVLRPLDTRAATR